MHPVSWCYCSSPLPQLPQQWWWWRRLTLRWSPYLGVAQVGDTTYWLIALRRTSNSSHGLSRKCEDEHPANISCLNSGLNSVVDISLSITQPTTWATLQDHATTTTAMTTSSSGFKSARRAVVAGGGWSGAAITIRQSQCVGCGRRVWKSKTLRERSSSRQRGKRDQCPTFCRNENSID